MGDPLMVALFWVASSRRRFAGNSWWQRKERNLDNYWHGILGRVKGWTSPCRSMPMTQPNRLLLSRVRMSRRLQSECGAQTTYLIAR